MTTQRTPRPTIAMNQRRVEVRNSIYRKSKRKSEDEIAKQPTAEDLDRRRGNFGGVR